MVARMKDDVARDRRKGVSRAIAASCGRNAVLIAEAMLQGKYVREARGRNDVVAEQKFYQWLAILGLGCNF
jgi:hypothetical protein